MNHYILTVSGPTISFNTRLTLSCNNSLILKLTR